MYTKGEWKAKGSRVYNEDDDVIAFVNDGKSFGPTPISEANAHLIAAAPLLYEACKMLLDHMTMARNESGRPYLADVKRQAHKALAKVEAK